MSRTTSTRSPRRKRIATKRLASSAASCHGVTDRQELVPGFDQKCLERSSVNQIGAGGNGAELGEGLVRKGIGRLGLYDDDTVELSNLNRQLFFRRDLHKKKALRLAVNLAEHATCGTVVEGYSTSLQEAIAFGLDLRCSVAVIGVDNDAARIVAARLFGEMSTPVVFVAVDLVAENGYVFVQEPGQACFGCAFPKALAKPGGAVCRSPACKDILKVVAGIALYAIDSLLMPGRKRGWNYRNVHLAGFAPSNVLSIERRAECPLCGKWNRSRSPEEADR